MNLSKNRLLGILFIAAPFFLSLLVYSNTFHSTFHFDDLVLIVKNMPLRNFDFASGLGAMSFGQKARFITFFTFALNYRVHQLDVFGYHLVNFVIHVTTVYLVWWLMRLVFSTPRLEKEPLCQHKKSIAFLTALIFLSHPVLTQAVTYISQRAASLATLFYIAAMCFYVQGRLSWDKKHPCFLSLLAATIAAFLGMFTKEIIVTLPLSIILFEYFFLKTDTDNKTSGRYGYLLGMIIVLLFFGVLAKTVPFSIKNLLSATHISESHVGDILTFPVYLLTQFRVIVTFIRLLFFPVGLNLDYDFPASHSFFEPATSLSFLLIVIILAAAVKLKTRHVLVSYGIFWFFLTISANLVPRENVIFEHKLYLSSIGFSMALCAGIFTIIKDRKKAVISLIFITGVLSVLTFQRNKVWKNEITLFEDVVKKSPHKARPHLILGAAYTAQGKDDSAFLEFNKVLEINPASHKAYTNRGILYARLGKYDLALRDFNKAIAIDPKGAAAYINRGNLYRKTRQLDKALADYSAVILPVPARIRPGGKVAAYNNRGITYVRMGKDKWALKDFNAALRINPQFAEAYINRGNIYLKRGQYEQAITDYSKALDLQSNNREVYHNRSLAYRAQNEFQRARADALRAESLGVKINPNYLLKPQE